MCTEQSPISLSCEEQEGAQNVENRRNEHIVQRRAQRKTRTRLGSCGATCPGCAAETERRAAGISGTPERICPLNLDTSEMPLHILSCRIATPLPVFPILPPSPPQYICTGTALLSCVRRGKESTPCSILFFLSVLFVSSPQIE